MFIIKGIVTIIIQWSIASYVLPDFIEGFIGGLIQICYVYHLYQAHACQLWDPHLVGDIELLKGVQKFACLYKVCLGDWNVPIDNASETCSSNSGSKACIVNDKLFYQ